jgi:hypothetical protein
VWVTHGDGLLHPRQVIEKIIRNPKREEEFMAIIRKLEPATLERESMHTEADCTYTIVADEQGKKSLQIDTYGSATRKIPGKKSQSIRFSPEPIEQLRSIPEIEV